MKKLLCSLIIGLLLSGPVLAVDPQAKRIQTDTSDFDGNLSSLDTDVQKALETLDDLDGMIYPGAGLAKSTGSAWDTSITDNSSNWDTAYGWGNHAGLYLPIASTPWTAMGYLTAETDPVFEAWLLATPPLYSETDPLSLHLDQTTPQTVSGGLPLFSSGLKASADNAKIYFGAGDDASITYDGTNIVINPKEVGTGKVNILGDLDLGTTTTSDDVLINLTSLNKTGINLISDYANTGGEPGGAYVKFSQDGGAIWGENGITQTTNTTASGQSVLGLAGNDSYVYSNGSPIAFGVGGYTAFKIATDRKLTFYPSSTDTRTTSIYQSTDGVFNFAKVSGNLTNGLNTMFRFGTIGGIDSINPFWNAFQWVGHTVTESGANRYPIMSTYSRSAKATDPTDYEFVFNVGNNGGLPTGLSFCSPQDTNSFIRFGFGGTSPTAPEVMRLTYTGTNAGKIDFYKDTYQADNIKSYFGSAGDASIYYDGTNLVINPKEVGSGYLSVLGDIDAGANTIRTTGDVKGIHKAADGTAAVADGTYTVGIGTSTNGTITIKDGIITAITEAT
ncbi:MAG: hypothetical protein BWY42_00971 [Candidatus Omnitrophica bacterium ADurb.Bin277]|nr:MAG: hypothetical protein BWY42_00971 [Candidatus Omnitrophica bacterium ADurb.Bin277]